MFSVGRNIKSPETGPQVIRFIIIIVTIVYSMTGSVTYARKYLLKCPVTATFFILYVNARSFWHTASVIGFRPSQIMHIKQEQKKETV